MKQLLSDLRYGFRMMRKAKGFAIVAVLTLAIGIGANTAIFSVVYGVLLRPLPYKDADRIVYIWHTPPQSSFPGTKTFAVSAANYFDWKAQNSSFEQMAITRNTGFTLTGAGQPTAMRGRLVSPEYFSLLGVQPALGRGFSPDQDQPGKEHVVILSNHLWQTQFGSDRNIVGRTVEFDQVPYTVIGVMPPRFGSVGTEFWAPLAFTPAERAVRGEHSLAALGKLKPGVDIRSAQAEMDTISRRLEQQYPTDDKGWGAFIIPIKEQAVGDVRPTLLVLLGAVAFVLLIACANVANLMLAKILDRRGEMAVRTALGASRSRILQQLLSEAVLLSLIGGIFGTILAKFGVDLLVRNAANMLPRVGDITVDWWVLAFTMLISVAAGVITGVAPALRLSDVNMSDALKHGGRNVDAGGKSTRSVLVVAEVALSLMLLAGAGLLLRSLWNLQNVAPGFDPHGVFTAELSVPRTKFTEPVQAANFYLQVQQKLRTIPGAESAAFVDDLPLNGGSKQHGAVAGRSAVAPAEQPG